MGIDNYRSTNNSNYLNPGFICNSKNSTESINESGLTISIVEEVINVHGKMSGKLNSLNQVNCNQTI